MVLSLKKYELSIFEALLHVFNKILSVFLLVIAINLFFLTPVYSRTKSLTIFINESHKIQNVSANFFGLNHNWIHSETIAWDHKNNQESMAFLELLSDF